MSYRSEEEQIKLLKKTVKWVAIVVVLLLVTIIPACNYHSVVVEPGHEIVLVDNPRFFGHEGVRDEPLRAGRAYVWDTTTDWSVDMTPQTVKVVFDDFASQDSILLDFESSIQYHVTNSPLLIKKFGAKWFENNLAAPYASIVRSKVKLYSMPKIMNDPITSGEMDSKITAELLALVKSIGLPIAIDGVSLGRAKPNEKVLEQMNETAAEQQRKLTLTAAKDAEVERKESEQARANADNAYRNEMKLDTQQFIQLQQAKLYSAACQAAANCIVTSGQNPLVLTPRQ